MTARSVARVVVIAALILNGLTGLLASAFSPLAIPFFLWSLLPFGILWIAARVVTDPWIIGGAGLGPMKGKIWRIGLMGETSSPENVQRCLAALKQILKR